MTMNKSLVIGLDGATFDLILPLIQKGKLKAISKLISNGVHGKLRSTIPSITGPAWVSFATGKNPGKHGCYDFLIPMGNLDETKSIDTTMIEGKTFYEILHSNGAKCVLINLPCSYPPRIEGIILSSFLDKTDNYVFPKKLVDEIPYLKNYRVITGTNKLTDNILEHIEEINKLEKTKFECAKILFKEDWHFFFILFSATDWIQHSYYRDLINEKIGVSHPAVEVFEKIDQYIDWFIENSPSDCNIFIMSDHGFKSVYSSFAINKWLMNENYLVTEEMAEPPARTLFQKQYSLSTRKIKIPRFLLDNPYFMRIGLWFYFSKFGNLFKFRPVLNTKPVTSRTKAYCLSSGADFSAGIYINKKSRFKDGIVEDYNEYDKLRNEIKEKLSNLKDPKNGKKILSSIDYSENIYRGNKTKVAPDLIISSEEYLITSRYIPMIFHGNLEFNGAHAINGIFIAYGPDIKKSKEIENAEIIDLAPTILHMHGIHIPADMDGRVLTEIFKDNSEITERTVLYQQINGEKEKIKQKIKKLKSNNL